MQTTISLIIVTTNLWEKKLFIDHEIKQIFWLNSAKKKKEISFKY